MDTKTCKRCSTSKPHSEFNRDRTGKFGLSAYCKLCNRAKVQAWRDANPEGHRNTNLKYRYKITAEKYDEMLAAQGGGCAICGGENEHGKALAVDHDHTCCPGKFSCGKCIRGLLCEACNMGLGKFDDSPQRLQAAIDYLSCR